jgi:hypothetical protein
MAKEMAVMMMNLKGKKIIQEVTKQKRSQMASFFIPLNEQLFWLYAFLSKIP